MIEIFNIASPNVYRIRITNKMTQEDAAELEELITNPETPGAPLRMVAEVHELPSYEGFKAFLDATIVSFKALGKVSRYAIISQISWLDKLAPVGNALLPGIRMRYFPTENHNDAILWVQQDDPELWDEMELVHVPAAAAIYRYTINGKVDRETVQQLYALIDQDAAEEKIALMGVLKNFTGFRTASAFIELFKGSLSALKNVRKYAFLTDNVVATTIGKAEAELFPDLPVRIFNLDQEHEAMNWLKDGAPEHSNIKDGDVKTVVVMDGSEEE